MKARKFLHTLFAFTLMLLLTQCVAYRPTTSSSEALQNYKHFGEKISNYNIFVRSNDSALFKMNSPIFFRDTLSGFLELSNNYEATQLDSLSYKEEVSKKNTLILNSSINLKELLVADALKFNSTRFTFNSTNIKYINHFQVDAGETVGRTALLVLAFVAVSVTGIIIANSNRPERDRNNGSCFFCSDSNSDGSDSNSNGEDTDNTGGGGSSGGGGSDSGGGGGSDSGGGGGGSDSGGGGGGGGSGS